jgi:hypothetical protein
VAITPPYNSQSSKDPNQTCLQTAFIITSNTFTQEPSSEKVNDKGEYPRILAKTSSSFIGAVTEPLARRGSCGLIWRNFLRKSLSCQLCFQTCYLHLSSLQLLMILVHFSSCPLQIRVQSSSHTCQDVDAIIASCWHHSHLCATCTTRHMAILRVEQLHPICIAD